MKLKVIIHKAEEGGYWAEVQVVLRKEKVLKNCLKTYTKQLMHVCQLIYESRSRQKDFVRWLENNVRCV
jgi:hypothetical protein